MEKILKFNDPYTTAKGEVRASVELKSLKILWFNTGSLCNLACENCYIESSPRNNRLSFINEKEVANFLTEIKEQSHPVELIGFTGGEPFANPYMISILRKTLEEGFEVLVLTNAYKAIKKYYESLLSLRDDFGDKLKIRISLDHYSQEMHEAERGKGTFQETLETIKFLVKNNIHTSIAGRSLKKEPSDLALQGYQDLLTSKAINLKLYLGENIVIFPEMDQNKDVPEITVGCWDILNINPSDQMCSSERMIIKKKGNTDLTVMPCTLLAYDEQFELGTTLKNSVKKVQLNHRFCAEFCVLGGASCSATK
jgi:sulfatase maturation enzyme AslB (radical SAM superfamily)